MNKFVSSVVTGFVIIFTICSLIFFYTMYKVSKETYPLVVTSQRIAFQPGVFSGDTKFKTIYTIKVFDKESPQYYEKTKPLCCTFSVGDTIGYLQDGRKTYFYDEYED